MLPMCLCVEESKFCLFSVVFPVRCISSVSPRFYFRRHAFCLLPLASILESLLYCIWTWNFFCLFVFAFVFCFFFPFDEKMTELLHKHWEVFKTGDCRTNTKIIKNKNLLHFNLWLFCLFYLFFILCTLSSLCLSNACVAYCWLVCYLSLFISMALLLFFLVGVFLFVCFVLFCFSFSLPSLLSLSSHPSILDITIVIITS
jgi:hypothetical protein